MSVPVAKRNPSTAEFVNSAYDLHIMTIRLCLKMDKRITFFLAQDISKLASKVHAYAKMANSIYPKFKDDVLLRRKYLNNAFTTVQALYSFIDIAYGLNQVGEHKITQHQLEEWLELAGNEVKLLSAVKKSDEERYKKLLS